MIKLDGNLEPVLTELREIIGSIKGVTKVDDTLMLSYVVIVEDESAKSNVGAVAAKLSTQAEKHGIVLEITPATQEEFDEAQKRMAEYLKSQSAGSA